MTLGPVLDGIRVVALEHAVAAPLATRHLADLGADVVKIERPGVGDFARSYDRRVHGEASYFVWLNRGKRSVELDLKDEADLAVVRALLDEADVLVCNLAPGALGRLGIDPVTLRERNPRLITCQVSGYGETGPHRERKAYDLLIQAELGLLDVTGEGPVRAKVGISVADIATGMYTFSAVLGALYERERTGVGSELHIAMLDALGEWMGQPYYYSGYGGPPALRTGVRHATIAPYGPFRADDGEIFIAVQSDREFGWLCEQVLGRPELARDPRFVHNTERVAHMSELTDEVEAGLVGLTVAQARERLDAAGVANTTVGHAADLADHPQLLARGRWGEVMTPGGPVRAMLSPLQKEGDALRAVPRLGEHTDEVRRSVGHD